MEVWADLKLDVERQDSLEGNLHDSRPGSGERMGVQGRGRGRGEERRGEGRGRGREERGVDDKRGEREREKE